MNRLTKKYFIGKDVYGSPDGTSCDDLYFLHKVYNKLGQLEDIEEELGIDLITKDKVEKSGICYWKDKNKKIHQLFINETERIGAYVENIDGQKWFLYYWDYGKTWALTKEELENGR